MQLFAGGEALNGGDFPLSNRRDLRDARALGLPINENCASPTLAFSASVLGSGQIQMVAQGGQQAGLRVCLEGVRTVVYRKMKGSHGELRESGSLESDPLSKMIYPLQGARKTEVPQVRVRSLDANLGSGTSAPT